MGLRAPFGYVGNEVVMGETLIWLLDKYCGMCHTNEDYGSCKKCPTGQLVYECRDYLQTAEEEDKRYAMYADGEAWLAKRREIYGEHADSPEERDKWRQLSARCKPECDVKRRIKRAIKHIEPHPFFHSQWIFERARNADPLLKLRELVKDLDFIHMNRFRALDFQGDYEKRAKLRMREELEPLLIKEERETRNDTTSDNDNL